MTVAAVVYSRNEADLLPPCLAALTGFDEVIVCDMQSTDDTVGVAERAGARVVEVPDARVIEEVRQRGLDAAGTSWVMFVDADEILPPGFSAHVRRMIASADSDGTVAYRLPYANVAFGRPLHSTLVGSAKYSLMSRSGVRFPTPGRAHVPPDFDGPVKDAPPSVPQILHLNFRGAEQTVEKTLRYSPDVAGESSLLTPTGLIRALLRATVFSRVWADGYAGVAVATATVFGRWYAALLRAERAGILGDDLPARELRRLSSASRWQEAAIRSRETVRSVTRRSRRASRRPE
ncbi:glycosyltransferase [Planctomonas sp. JC2975]|uniref:glycosyltransferase n=1 Tax=Planctomonas sp. JC2975 TaxID=2729626 RepID=UPI001473EA63|nr:glycosyltransferase [Planctomonas sp. JC2975]NNC11869.1 glycosyltransferase [Planctomonas sp. JC2975]